MQKEDATKRCPKRCPNHALTAPCATVSLGLQQHHATAAPHSIDAQAVQVEEPQGEAIKFSGEDWLGIQDNILFCLEACWLGCLGQWVRCT